MDKPFVDFPDGPPPASLLIEDLETGTGPEAVAGKRVAVHYVGVAYSTGEEFDSSYDRGEPIVFPLGARRVIAGWDQGIAGMRVGGRRKLTIPHSSPTGTAGREGSSSPARP